MKFITNEYARLIKDGVDDIVIMPNTPFESIPAGYKITAYVIILSDDTGAVVAILKPGELTEELRETPIYTNLSLKDLRELARTAGISFSTKTTKDSFIRALGAKDDTKLRPDNKEV